MVEAEKAAMSGKKAKAAKAKKPKKKSAKEGGEGKKKKDPTVRYTFVGQQTPAASLRL
jgi:hypothetical protein